MNVLMISKSLFEWDVRVRREAEALAADGHQVTVIGLGEDLSTTTGVQVIGVGGVSGLGGRARDHEAIWYRTGRWMLLPEHRARAVDQFQKSAIEAAQRVDPPPEVIHAHDFPALPPSVELADRFSSRLVYDSHEYWAGLPRVGRPEPLRRRRNQRLEARLAREADVVITVSPHGADLLAEKLGLARVEVIRNTFGARLDLTPPVSPIGAVYSGRIAAGRDLETAFAARLWKERAGFDLHLMGEIDDVEIPPAVVIHPMGSMAEVEELLAEVGIGLVTMTAGPINHRIALPNKLFQSISVGVPVVAADLPQTAAVVSEHRVGSLYTPGDHASFSHAVERVIEEYDDLVVNVQAVRAQYDWKVDSSRLTDIYRRFEPRP